MGVLSRRRREVLCSPRECVVWLCVCVLLAGMVCPCAFGDIWPDMGCEYSAINETKERDMTRSRLLRRSPPCHVAALIGTPGSRHTTRSKRRDNAGAAVRKIASCHS